jgi:4-diphosphocytidyl-2-C-methyl-D-erythritol kinase
VTLRLTAPAKLNLGLEVVGRRDDGLHQLVSIMVNIDLADEVVLSPGSGLSLDGPYATAAPVDPAREITSRALAVLGSVAGGDLGLGVAINKRIPVGAGLGGGSGDAAAVLRAARALGVDVAADRLASLAMMLGADVPFQLRGGAGLVRGAGERVESLPVPELWAAVVFPDIQVSTSAVFGELRADEWSGGTVTEAAARLLRAGGGAGALSRLPNNLLAPATRVCPQLAEVIATLRKHGWDPRLTGTGSALFQVCFDRAEAESLTVNTWDLGLRAWAVRAIPAPPAPAPA